MADRALLESTKTHEGFVARPTPCPAGYLSIGYGTNLEAGISERQAEALMQIHYEDVVIPTLERYPWFSHIGKNRQRALAEMAYQLGVRGFKGFRKMLSAIELGNFHGAADEMLDSNWHRQTPNRAEYCARLMREG